MGAPSAGDGATTSVPREQQPMRSASVDFGHNFVSKFLYAAFRKGRKAQQSELTSTAWGEQETSSQHAVHDSSESIDNAIAGDSDKSLC
jgi:hypothetical protein